MVQGLVCCYSTSCFFFPFWMMTLFMDNQYNKLLLATINPQELSLIIYPPPPQWPIHFNIVYQGQAYTRSKSFSPSAQAVEAILAFPLDFSRGESGKQRGLNTFSACACGILKRLSLAHYSWEPVVLGWHVRSIHEVSPPGIVISEMLNEGNHACFTIIFGMVCSRLISLYVHLQALW